ncbi:right-handed parallel beta-helix repeat-containing protein [uncultured Streptococcus sp.]|uniref:right-handed parallel beta-helix repeat-containing protein n=1 Tax=uncultured Streptococcus sp. TaxID=83427 RepID=UPI002590E796|nr:right-handed parallel beta-helix repeat-containing protein [uncultured Streptococcus sp.]
MRNLKRKSLSTGFGLLLALAALLSNFGPGPVIVKADSVWNFSDSKFTDLASLSSEKTIDGLTFQANENSPLSTLAESVTVAGNDYSNALLLKSQSEQNDNAIKIPVATNDVIKVTMKRNSDTESASLAIFDEQGQELTSVEAKSEVSEESYTYTGNDGFVYLRAKVGDVEIFKLEVNSAEATDESTTESTSESQEQSSTSDSIEVNLSEVETADEATISTSLAAANTTVSTYKDLLSAISKAEKAGGGKVYVKGQKIACDGQIALSKANANVQIIGVQNADGSYPELDFSNFMAKYVGKASSDAAVGVRISGSNYTVQNIIVEHAPDNGIQIKGKTAGNNKVSNCIVRYNNDAGLQITAGAYKKTIEAIYSYRNCDVYTRGGNADGFAPKLGAGTGNTFTYCYAWDNSDDGWDSFDKAGDVTPDITYTNCAVWNNGNPDVFTGKYDFDHKKALDGNLHLVQLIKAKDASFASNYAKGKFSLPSGNFIQTDAGTVSLSAWTGSSFDGNPNGFKLGSVNSKSSVTRSLSYCLAFDEAKKGFDNNNSSVTGYFNHCVAFDNGYNYYIQPLSIKGWTSVQGFSGKSADKLPSGRSVVTPASGNQSSIRKSVESTKNTIIANCQANKIPGKTAFNIY